MTDYSQGKIYTIRCRSDDSLIYVGSTCQKLCKRFQNHKTTQKKGIMTISLYKYIDDWNDWYIELYEDCKCENREQLCRKEGEIIREIGTINKSIAGRTKQEYREENREKEREYNREYNRLHYEKRLEWKENNKEHIIERNRLYRIANKERDSEWRKQYYKENEDKKIPRNEKRKERRKNTRITCGCGKEVDKEQLKRHSESKFHQDWESKQN